jgi:tetratricopeptide (TPR) repeat protein
MKKPIFLVPVLSIAGLMLFTGCASRPAGVQDSAELSRPNAVGGGEAFLPVPQDLYDRSFPQGGLYGIPEDPRAAPLVRRAGAYEEKKQWRAAGNTYALAYKRAGKGAAAPYILFKRCVLDEDLNRSVEGLRELLQGFPSFPLIDAVRLELAVRLSLQRQYEPALSALSGAENGDFAPYAAALSGELYYKLGKYEQSLDSYERSRGGLAEAAVPSVVPSGDFFPVRCYLGMAKTLIARGDETGRKGAWELLRRIAGTPSHPFFQAEALDLLRGISQKGEQPAPDLISDEALLRGSYRLGPDGRLLPAERPFENPRGQAAEGNDQGNYTVQIGSFGKRENADNMVSEITGKGFSGFLSEATVGGKPLFRVKVGPFANLPEAEEVKKRLGALGYSGFVVLER